jgi:hypothetical protein
MRRGNTPLFPPALTPRFVAWHFRVCRVQSALQVLTLFVMNTTLATENVRTTCHATALVKHSARDACRSDVTKVLSKNKWKQLHYGYFGFFSSVFSRFTIQPNNLLMFHSVDWSILVTLICSPPRKILISHDHKFKVLEVLTFDAFMISSDMITFRYDHI